MVLVVMKNKTLLSLILIEAFENLKPVFPKLLQTLLISKMIFFASTVSLFPINTKIDYT